MTPGFDLFSAHKERQKRIEQYIDAMKREPGKSPFDETVIDCLELLLEYFDKAPAI